MTQRQADQALVERLRAERLSEAGAALEYVTHTHDRGYWDGPRQAPAKQRRVAPGSLVMLGSAVLSLVLMALAVVAVLGAVGVL